MLSSYVVTQLNFDPISGWANIHSMPLNKSNYYYIESTSLQFGYFIKNNKSKITRTRSICVGKGLRLTAGEHQPYKCTR